MSNKIRPFGDMGGACGKMKTRYRQTAPRRLLNLAYRGGGFSLPWNAIVCHNCRVYLHV